MVLIPVPRDITITVEQGDALQLPADVLALKYADHLYGVDLVAVLTLDTAGLRASDRLPKKDDFCLIASQGALAAQSVLFLAVGDLYVFDYGRIRDFGRRVISLLARHAPDTRHVCLTLHGTGYGLDEAEAFKAELAGLFDAISADDYPPYLERITIVELDEGRAERLSALLGSISAGEHRRASPHPGYTIAVGADVPMLLHSAGAEAGEKAHVFVAMPFTPELDDLYHYGIYGAVRAAGYVCERADLAAFTGDVIGWVRDRIATADLLVAELSSANPNVFLEVGFAWGKDIPTILLATDSKALPFDVRGQRCLTYKSIRELEQTLGRELKLLRRR